MVLNLSKGNMYGFVTHTWNPIKGKCLHDCHYCLVGNSKILMEDFSLKKIKDIKKGERIIGIRKENGNEQVMVEDLEPIEHEEMMETSETEEPFELAETENEAESKLEDEVVPKDPNYITASEAQSIFEEL